MNYTLDIRHKRCSLCGIYKPCLDSVWSRNSKGRFRSECKCCRAYFARLAPRPGIRLKPKSSTPLTPEQLLKRREHGRRGQARYRAKYPEKVAAYKRKWAERNPEYRKAQKARRRARIREVGGTITTNDVKQKYLLQQRKCFYCCVSLENGYHVDHIIPISRGGENSPTNIVLACPKCNMSKHDKTPEEWELWKQIRVV